MIASEYANALYELALEDDKEDIIDSNLNDFVSLLGLNPDFKKIIETNTIRHNRKIELLKNVLKGFDSLFIDFLAVVNDHDRFKEINNIMVEYKKIIDNAKNILHVDVMSCYKLQEDELKRIRNALERKYPSKNIEITNVIDESLIGGINIVCNGQNYDISLKRQLDVMKASL